MTGAPLNIDVQQILLHFFNFTILFAILYFILYKPVKGFISKREEYYRDMDDKAQEAMNEAESMKEEYLQKMKDVEEEIREQKERVRLDLEQATAKKLKDATEEAGRIITNARREAEIERQKIINSAQADISNMVAESMEKLALEALASDAFDQFLDATERGKDNE